MKKAFILIFVLLAAAFIIFLLSPDVAPDLSNLVPEPTEQARYSFSTNNIEPQPTPTSPATITPTVSFAVIGDYGDPSGPADQVADLIKSWNVDAIVTTGDNAYPSGTEQDLVNANLRYADFISECKFFPALGNHDWGQANPYTIENLPSTKYFTCLQGSRYYSAVLGDGLVKIIVLSTDSREPDVILQSDFLQRELLTPEPYKFVFTHEPPYASCEGKTSDRSRLNFVGVTAVFSGHCHLYEHLNVDGMTYIVQGAGGGGQTDQFNAYQEGSLLQYNAQKGAVLVEVTPEAAKIYFIAVDGSVIEEFYLSPTSK